MGESWDGVGGTCAVLPTLLERRICYIDKHRYLSMSLDHEQRRTVSHLRVAQISAIPQGVSVTGPYAFTNGCEELGLS